MRLEQRPDAAWPHSFTEGTILTPTATGRDDLMGTRAPWLASYGRHAGFRRRANESPGTRWRRRKP